jgi:hypothetical protein
MTGGELDGIASMYLGGRDEVIKTGSRVKPGMTRGISFVCIRGNSWTLI